MIKRVIIITGDCYLPKKEILYSTLHNEYPNAIDSFDIIDFDTINKKYEAKYFHKNPDYTRRMSEQQDLWHMAIEKTISSLNECIVILASCYLETGAGFEFSYPSNEYLKLIEIINTNNLDFSIVCLIDDAYVTYNGKANLFRNLICKQLEFTQSQYLVQTATKDKLFKCYLVSLHQPQQNFVNILFNKNKKSTYLCYPVNYFRRGRNEDYYLGIEKFKKYIINTGVSFYDPMCIDEEPLISDNMRLINGNNLTIRTQDRWKITYEEIFNSQPQIKNNSNGILEINEFPTKFISRIAKSQTPQRDFFWIKHSDFVTCWRPYIEGMHHAGVMAEIQYAIHNNIPVIAYGPYGDLEEHPSPFASMLQFYTDEAEFKEAIQKMAFSNSETNSIYINPPKYCDHTSVGVIIYNDLGEILIIERGTFPFGYAVPAGHVDKHSSYEEAAISEVKEEVGLDITDLKLVAEGKRDNPCRRINGTWHYWKIYEAKASGALTLSEREVKKAMWCNNKQLVELGIKSESSNSIEPIWKKWFGELNILKD